MNLNRRYWFNRALGQWQEFLVVSSIARVSSACSAYLSFSAFIASSYAKEPKKLPFFGSQLDPTVTKQTDITYPKTGTRIALREFAT